MKKGSSPCLYSIYAVILAATLLIAFIGDRTVTAIAEEESLSTRSCVIIDAGHGGIDTGATSCTGVYESMINLEIAMRLDALMHLLGIQTVMIRTTDESIYTQGNTIAAQKVSDLKQRVSIAERNSTDLLISIHQNHYADSRYSGAQVFYADTKDSKSLATTMQSTFVSTLNQGSKRSAKQAKGIYLMEHITCPGILIECGFLSNPVEETNLRSEQYQKNICSIIAAITSQYLHNKVSA